MTERVRIDSSGNVGVGTSTPSQKLEIYQGNIQIDNNQYLKSRLVAGTAVNIIGYNTSNQTVVGANAELILGGGSNYIKAGSNFGIGETTPTESLVVAGQGTGRMLVGDVGFGDGYTGLSMNGVLSTTNYNLLGSPGQAHLWINRASGGDIFFREANSNQVVIKATTGNVGIGTASPADRLSVAVPTGTIEIANFSKTQTTNDTGALLALWGGSTGETVRGYLGFAHTGTGADTTFTGELADALNLRSEGAFQLGTNGNNIRLTVASGGNVGIGTASPAQKLSVHGTGGSPATSGTTQNGIFRITNNSNNLALDFGQLAGAPYTSWIQNTNSPDLSINYPLALNPNGGNVGIGTTTPDARLDVQAAGNTKLFNFSASSAGTGFVYGHIKNTGGTTLLATEGSATGNVLVGSLAYASAFSSVGATALQLGTNQTARLTILPTSGNVGIGTTTPNTKLAFGVAGDRIGIDLSGGGTTRTSFIELYSPTSGALSLRTDNGSTGGIELWTEGSQRLTVDQSGNVGIGTTSPNTKLQIYSNSGNGSLYELLSVDGGTLSTTVSGSGVYTSFRGTSNTQFGGVGGYGNGTLTGAGLWGGTVTGAPDLYVTSAGNVGIGTASPQTTGHIYSSTADGSAGGRTTPLNILTLESENTGSTEYNGFGQAIVFRGSTYNESTQRTLGRIVHSISDDSGNTTRGTALRFETSDNGSLTTAPTEKMRIDYNGNIGLGDQSPDAKLDILQSSDVATQGLQISRSNDTDFMRMYMSSGLGGLSDTLIFSSAFAGDVAAVGRDGSAYFAGNVGIGTNSPGTKLDVNGYVRSKTGYLDRNMLDTTVWTVSSGTIGGFSLNGEIAENERVWSTDPLGRPALIWKSVNDVGSNADGGWDYANIPVSANKAYRSSVWVKKDTTSSGTVYFGANSDNSTLDLAGTTNNNPYYFALASSNLIPNRWYLFVGYIHANNDASVTSYSGVYDGVTGQKVFSGTDYKNSASATIQTHRAYNYYDTTTGSIQYFANPRFEEINGTEPSIEAMLGVGQGATLTSNAYFGGNVGIGTTTPNALLTLNSGEPRIRLNIAGVSQMILNHDGTTGVVRTESATPLDLGTNGSTRLTITSAGNVGIGTVAPQSKFDVVLANDTTASVGGSIGTGNYAGLSFGYREENTLYRKTAIVYERQDGSARGKIHLLNNGTGDSSSATLADAKLTIQYDGNIGIGTTTPLNKLSIYTGNTSNANEGISLTRGPSGDTIFGFRQKSDGSGVYRGAITTKLGANAEIEALTVSTGGYVGIGDATPAALFTVGSGDLLQISSTGAIGSPADTDLVIDSGLAADANRVLIGNNDWVEFQGDGVVRGGIGAANNVLSLFGGTSNTSHLAINSSGNVGIGTTNPATFKLQVAGSVGPESDNSYDLGTASRRFRTLYTNTAPDINGYHDISNDNLLTNGDFETNTTTGWSGLTTVTTGGYSGNYTSQTTAAQQVLSDDYIPVNPVTDVLQLEGWFKKTVAGTTPGVIYFGYIAYDSAKVAITTAPCGTYCYFASSGYAIPADSTWHKLSATTNGEGTSYPNFPVGTKYVRVLVLINYAASSDAVTQMDHVTLKRINNGPLFVGNNFDSTNLVDQTQATKLYTTSSNNFIITPPSSGNVGIGTTNPGSKLTVTGDIAIPLQANNFIGASVSNGILFDGTGNYNLSTQSALGLANVFDSDANGSGTYFIGKGATDPDSATHFLDITNAGLVGIGTTTPGFKLDVSATGSVAQFYQTSGGSNTLTLNTNFASGNAYALNPFITGVSNGGFSIRDVTNSVDRMVISTAGNVGIGTASPGSDLEIYGATPYLTLNSSNGTAADAEIVIQRGGTPKWAFGTQVGDGTENFNFYNYTTATTNLTLQQSTGNIGIGTASPAGALDIRNANSVTTGLQVGGGTVGTYLTIHGNASAGGVSSIYTNYFSSEGDLVLGTWTNRTNQLYLKSNGNVGVGTSNPDTKLNVHGATLNSDSGAYVNHYRDVAHAYLGASTQTGTLKIALPTSWSDTMFSFTIKGYDYSGYGAWEVVVGGYNYAGGPYWVNTSAEIRGQAPFTSVRLAHDGTKNVILLGTTATQWNYASVVVSDVIAGYNAKTGWGSGWVMSLITSETGIAQIDTPVAPVTTDSSNNQTFSGSTNMSGNTYTTYGPNGSWGAYLRVGGNGRTVNGDNYASVVATDGNLHMDAGNAKTMYLNYYAGTGGIQFCNGASGCSASVSAGGVFSGQNFSGAGTGLTGTASSLTVGALSNFVNQSGSRYTTDFNTLLQTGFYNGEGTPANAPNAYGQMIVAKGVDTGLQIAGGYNSDNLYFRGWWSSGAGFSSWRTVLHNGNYAGYSAFSGAITGASLNVGSGAITSGAINGQTISSSANFTGTLNVATSLSVGGTGVITQGGNDVYANVRVIRSQSTVSDGMYINYGGTGGSAKIYDGGTSYAAVVGSGGTFTIPGYMSITEASNSSGNLRFSAANPYIYASSYFVAPGGAYFNSGTVYMEAQLRARGGIANDTGATLTIGGGTSGYTNFTGNVGIGVASPTDALNVGTVLAVSTTDTSNNIFSVATSTGTSYFDIIHCCLWHHRWKYLLSLCIHRHIRRC
ncbi:MAG: Uncharacterized protein Greene07147_898 [Parcubacteria group bacterium Greene0714_7]|nr:MAG: Uncharacterized protein Greene07147_898 [Parcubacteria group bacterium Greene0714_7]